MSGSTSKVTRVPRAEAPTFGKYHLIAKLGQGGMADVFLAIARGPVGFNKLVVIKRLKDGVAEEVEFHGMFMDEARLAARLNHPNVVQTNEVGKIERHYFLCMEYLEGQPLNRVMVRRNRGPEGANLAEMLRVVCDALSGLHYAHELADYDGTVLSVVHRDVSPHNIFVTYDGVAKVVDFGIAKAAVRSSYTSTGVVKGKISYMAPEQALSAPIDRRADVFSMGVILWELAAGERLWGSLTEVQILQKMAFGEVPRLHSKKPDAPAELDRICAKALAMVPGDRYATAAELRDEVEAYMKANQLVAGPNEVGALVATMFKDRRAEVKTVVQDQLKGMKEDGTLQVRDVSIPDIAVQTESKVVRSEAPPPGLGTDFASESRFEATPSATGIGTHTSEILRPVVRRRRRSVVLAGFGGAAILAIGALALIKSGVLSASGLVPVPPPLASPSAVSSAAPAGALIEVHIDATPPTATIYIDDVAVSSNPFAARFASDGTGHRVRVEAPGYKPQTRMVVYDKDVAVTIALEDAKAGAEPGPEATNPASTGSARGPSKPPTGRHQKGTKVDPTDPFK